MAILNGGYGLCPGKRRTFAVRVAGRFLPGVKSVQPLFCFASGSQVFPVHVNAKIVIGVPI
jgi:hypothetical protein